MSTQFVANDSLKEVYKSSLFQDLYKERNKILDKYPEPHKGLKFPDPNIKLGSQNYSFKTSETVDKINQKIDKDTEFQQRYKKTKNPTKAWDVSLKKSLPFLGPGLVSYFKYEQRDVKDVSVGPCYVAGIDYSNNGLKVNAKVNFMTTVWKKSVLYQPNFINGVTVACDVLGSQGILAQPNKWRFNLGGNYKHNFGTTCLAYNNAGLVTVSHVYSPDKNLTIGTEIVQALPLGTGKPGAAVIPRCPFTFAAGYQVDRDTHFKARVNNSKQVHTCLTRNFSPQVSVQAGAVFDLSNPEQLLSRVPGVGFKVAIK